jgi:hypothetical protein
VTKDLRLKIYPAVIGVLGVCLIASLFANVQIEVNQGITSPAPELERSPTVASPTSPSPQPIASPSPLPSPIRNEPSLLAAPTESLPAIGIEAQGDLRVSNQTNYPLRVALLHQQSSDTSPTFSQPVHWDFAPGEGEAKGLILSLPNQNLQLQPGDVLVAFAQDGSRRYWGPYVVGKTSAPVWNANTSEWQLILQP